MEAERWTHTGSTSGKGRSRTLHPFGKTAVIYTSRTLQMPDTEDKDQILAVSVAISEAVTSIIGNLEIKPRFIVAKGGIHLPMSEQKRWV